ncbi:hypothetical protein AMTR_s00094p00134250 [Amborella trichopoda]|uniref:Uncharacterized protein n=1 Tax=Amborella trichopoda TaxID=13333 RepID=W1NUH8_AMBTC|nr:hypothetical protein AMTR_s00094p00134250 [Amborella trichopoda]
MGNFKHDEGDDEVIESDERCDSLGMVSMDVRDEGNDEGEDGVTHWGWLTAEELSLVRGARPGTRVNGANNPGSSSGQRMALPGSRQRRHARVHTDAGRTAHVRDTRDRNACGG